MEHEGETDTRAKASWNFAQEHARHVQGLIVKAMDYRLKGDLGNCYWTLNGIRILINPFLGKPRRIYFNKIEKVINKYIGRWELWKKSKDEGNPRKDLKEGRRKFSRLSNIYFLKVMDLLRELDYLPDKEDKTTLGF